MFGLKVKPHIYAPILTFLSIASQIFWLTLEISGQNDRIRSEVWPLSYPKDTIFVETLNFGALGTVEGLTIPRETVDIEEFSPISYESKFITCTSKALDLELRHCMRIEANDAIEFHGPFISTYQVPNEKIGGVTQLRFAIEFALFLQFLLIFDFFRKRQKPNEKWMKAWCIISSINNFLHIFQFMNYFVVNKFVFEINGWSVLWKCQPSFWFTTVVGIGSFYVLFQPVGWIVDHYHFDKRIVEKFAEEIAIFIIFRTIRVLFVIERIIVFGFVIFQFRVQMRKIVRCIHYPLRI